MAEIVLDRVMKRFGAATVLEETSFTVRDGEFFVLVGPSGCGKSTLLNMIVGLEDVSGGEIRLDGRVINDLDPKDRNMAMVFQSYAIYPHMTVRENIAFPLRIAKRPPQEIAERVERAAAMLELTALLDRRPRALSGGQRQRVAMGRAMVREPAVYLLDEPLSNLDARLRVQMRGELARLQQRLATTTLYVTHDQTEAMTLGDRVAVLRRGRVQQIGTPRELYAVPENLFVAGFIGSPSMNFLPARREGARLTVADTALTVPAASSPALPARPVVAIRPEAMRLQRRSGDDLSLRVRAEVVEWLGAEIYVYSTLAGDSNWLRGILPDDVGVEARRGDGVPLVVRLDAAAGVREGEMLELFVAPSALQLFDPASGRRLGTLASA